MTGRPFWNGESLERGQQEKADDAVMYVVYSFLPGERTDDLSDAETIIAVTPFSRVLISDDEDPESVRGMTFAVTSLDRMNRESTPVKIKL